MYDTITDHPLMRFGCMWIFVVSLCECSEKRVSILDFNLSRSRFDCISICRRGDRGIFQEEDQEISPYFAFAK